MSEARRAKTAGRWEARGGEARGGTHVAILVPAVEERHDLVRIGLEPFTQRGGDVTIDADAGEDLGRRVALLLLMRPAQELLTAVGAQEADLFDVRLHRLLLSHLGRLSLCAACARARKGAWSTAREHALLHGPALALLRVGLMRRAQGQSDRMLGAQLTNRNGRRLPKRTRCLLG